MLSLSYPLTAKAFLKLNYVAICSSLCILIGCIIHIMISLHFYFDEGDFMRLMKFCWGEDVALIFIITYAVLLLIFVLCISFKFRLNNAMHLTDIENIIMRYSILIGLSLAIFSIFFSIVSFFSEQNILNRTDKGMLLAMKKYNKNQELKELMDRIQIRHKCCGINSYQDWFKYNWYENKSLEEELEINLENKPQSTKDHIPFSCCSDILYTPCVHHFIQSNENRYEYDLGNRPLTLWQKGCHTQVLESYLRTFHGLNLLNCYILPFYIAQLLLDRIIQTADSSTMIDSYLRGWIYKKTKGTDLSTKKKQTKPLKRKYIKEFEKSINPILNIFRKKQKKSKRSVTFTKGITSFPIAPLEYST